jgi:hypothetical protein
MNLPAYPSAHNETPLGSGAELAEVMVEVLVHQDGPLLGSELAEEGVRPRGADCGAAVGKAVDHASQTVLLFDEIAVVVNYKTFGGGGVAAHGDLVLEHHGLDDAADETAYQRAGGRVDSEGHLNAARAVRHRLRGTHGTPLGRAVRLEVRDAVFYFLGG